MNEDVIVPTRAEMGELLREQLPGIAPRLIAELIRRGYFSREQVRLLAEAHGFIVADGEKPERDSVEVE